MGSAQIAAARAAAADAGHRGHGLHWLLVKPTGLSITARRPGVRRRTVDAMLAYVDLCAELGGKYLVHGSPQQRRIEAGDTREARWRAPRSAAAVAGRAAQAAW